AAAPVIIQKDDTILINVTVELTGLYQLGLSYQPESGFNTAPTIELKINDEVPFNEAGALPLEVDWEIIEREEAKRFNRYGNELLPYSKAKAGWYVHYLDDVNGRYTEPYRFLLNGGNNVISVKALTSSLMLDGLYLGSKAEPTSYEAYLRLNSGPSINRLIRIPAEDFHYKNDIEAKAGYYKSADVAPSAYKTRTLNILDGSSVARGGTRVTYRFTVHTSGLYKITFKYLQNMQDGLASARSIYFDGVIPYSELENYLFPTTKKWTNHTLNKAGEPLLVYLEAGEHTMMLETTLGVYQDYIEKLYTIMDEINGLGLIITSITGASKNKYTDWDILKYLPDLLTDLTLYSDEILAVARAISELNGSKKIIGEISSLKIAAKQLRRLSRRPNKIHLRLEELNVGSGSAYQLIGTAAGSLLFQPLSLDMIYLSGLDNKIPKSNRNVFTRFWFSVKSFFYSFFDKRYNYQISRDDDVLDVWVAQSPIYLDIIQNMIDDDFTAQTGIKAKVNILPTSQKIILNNATGTNPDVILSIDSWEPYNYALRGLLADLSTFPDFDQVTSNIYRNCFTPVIFEDGVYAIPETQGMNILFYRRDILDFLNVSPPVTWDDVLALLPILQSYRMNFYHPLGNETAYKGFSATSPFIYAFGGEIFSENGYTETFSREENIEAIKYMTDLFNIYNLPLQVANFFEHFRCGTLPIGIGTVDMYLQLKYAAPELSGQWDILPVPGFDRNGDGEVERWTTAYGKASILFASSKKQTAGWELIKWWNQTATQIAYTQNIKMGLGEKYLVIPANVEALLASPWEQKIKTQVAAAAQWSRIPAIVPGSYVVERELSNIWNRVVIDRKNVRVAVGLSVDKINRELIRKFEEFGYLKNGQVVKEYIVPNNENIVDWVKGRDYDE
ncbi:MAG: extracellular solute-binding protein, partial [Endomicrobiaceae bacterium]|nr:extracellular solute-binding protein [Endomicrobiaceae bacterium]